MRTRLLLALLAVPILGAALPADAAAQRDRVVRVYRDGDGYRDRIYIPIHRSHRSHRYREPAVRYRYDDRRYRDGYRIRTQYRYRDRDRYRYDYRRHHTSLADLILIAASEGRHRDRYRHRHVRRTGHGARIYIDLY